MGRQEDSRQEDRQFAKLKIENGYGIIPLLLGQVRKSESQHQRCINFQLSIFHFQ